MFSPVNSHSNATSRRWHLWEVDLRFAPGLPPGWPGADSWRLQVLNQLVLEKYQLLAVDSHEVSPPPPDFVGAFKFLFLGFEKIG